MAGSLGPSQCVHYNSYQIGPAVPPQSQSAGRREVPHPNVVYTGV